MRSLTPLLCRLKYFSFFLFPGDSSHKEFFVLILLLPDFIGQDFLDDTGSSRGKALQEVGAKREHKNLFVMEHPALLEQVHEAGDAGLIEAFKITSHWAHYRQPLSKSQECLRWVGKVKSWSVQGFCWSMLCLKSKGVREKGVMEKGTLISIVGGNIDWIITYRHSYTQLIAK